MLKSPIFQKIPKFLIESFIGSVLLVFMFWIFHSKQIIWFTTDSGAYLLNSIELKVPGDRTVFYSLFIAVLRVFFDFFGWKSLFPVVLIPLWLVVFASMHTFFRVVPQRNYRFKYWISIVVTLFGIWFSGALWIFLQIMPDGFTSIMFLSSFLWMDSLQAKRKIAAWFWGVVAVLSAVMHNGNLIPFTGIIMLNHIFKWINTKYYYRIRYKMELIFSILPWLIILMSNVYGNNGWTFSKNAPVFLLAKISENGVLKVYLEKTCLKESHPMCIYKGQLPDHAWDFIWPNDGIHMKLGGWYQTDSLYKKTINDILTDHSLLVYWMKVSVKDTWKQLILWGVGDGVIDASKNETISKVVNGSYDFEDGRELLFDFSEYNAQGRGFFLMCFVVFISVFTTRFRLLKHERTLIGFFVLFIGFCVLQAFSTGALANVLMRLNMRAVWFLLPIMLLFVIGEIIQGVYKIQIWFLRKYS